MKDFPLGLIRPAIQEIAQHLEALEHVDNLRLTFTRQGPCAFTVTVDVDISVEVERTTLGITIAPPEGEKA